MEETTKAKAAKQLFDRIDAAVACNDLETLKRMGAELFEAADAGPAPFSAALKLTPQGQRELLGGSGAESLVNPVEESALALNAANAIERGARHVAYAFKTLTDPAAVRVVAEGDSWFQYPFILDDVIDVLMRSHAVYCLSAAGDTVADMVRSGEYLETIAEKVPALFLFSGGGNDLVGDGRLRSILLPYHQGAKPRDLIDKKAFGLALGEVVRGYERILDKLKAEFPRLPMLSHAYDNPVNIKKGPWIWPYMQEKGIPDNVATAVVGEMLGQFGAELVKLQTRYPQFNVINVTGTVGKQVSDWHDALHPKNPGYAAVAGKFRQRMNELVRAAPSPTEAIVTATRRVRAPALATALPAGPTGRAAGGRETAREQATILDHERIRLVYEFPHQDYPVWDDFGPQEGWLRFDDPEVHVQIKEVISLLKARRQIEDAELVENRLRMQPRAMIGRTGFPQSESMESVAEAIIGEDDLEPIQHLIVGYRTARSVGRIARVMQSGSLQALGTGLLVAPGVLLTNHHVFPTEDDAARCVLLMDDEEALVGEERRVRRFKITPDLFLADANLDFAFASVALTARDGAELSGYGTIRLRSEPGKALKGESVSVIQHPDGKPKAIAIRNSLVMGRIGDGVYYTADTRPGSSGSVVLNREWEVVALHHRTVPHPTLHGQHLANRGIRISSIMAHVGEEAKAGSAQARTLQGALAGGSLSAGGRAPETASVADGPAAVAVLRASDADSLSAEQADPDDPQTRLYSTPDGDVGSSLPKPTGAIAEAARRLSSADVGWVATYSNNPDFWHLPASAEGAAFDVTAATLDNLLSAGRYTPHVTADGILVVAVRGARIVSGEDAVLRKPTIRLQEQKPDHATFRCVMMVYHKTLGLISAFQASTVPNRGAVASQYNKHAGFDGDDANMLPTGCYELCVGTHRGSVVMPTVLRLGTGPTSASALQVTTLRTFNDGVYGTQDEWDNCRPMDNIHPAFSAKSAEFSSLGCLTVPGSYSGGRHRGNWAVFRETALFNSEAKMGTRYNLVLTTGMELAAIADAVGDPVKTRSLARLAHGSSGNEVRKLQTAIGSAATGIFDADTKKALSNFERSRLAGKATGIYSARSEKEIGLGILI